MLSQRDVQDAYGKKVVDLDGNKIGKVEVIYLDNETDEPEFALVDTGMFSGRSSFVPLAEAQMADDAVRVPYSKDQVKDAPNMEADQELSEAEEGELYRYYGLEYSETRSDSGLPQGEQTTGTVDTDTSDQTRTEGYDVSGPTTDDAMTRSEEELNVGTRERETGKARLRKYVVTEDVTTTVPVEREKVRVEREPITDANVGEATEGPAISEEEHEVILHDEEAVVEKRAVPKERVRLDKETATEEQQVSDEVRKEEVEVEDGTGTESRR